MKKQILTFLAVAATVATFSAPAFAGGFIADTFIRPFSPQAADAADGLNRDLGHPVEQVGGAIAQSYGAPLSARCITPQGVFFGPFLPINSPCNVNGIWGVIQ